MAMVWARCQPRRRWSRRTGQFFAAAMRDRLGLSRTALEHQAYAYLDGAPHLRRHITKALAMHLADSVWPAVERHLFRDASGRRQGLLHVGRWHEFTRLPGRARSHTRERKWETFRLHGSLTGHRARFTGPDGDFKEPPASRRSGGHGLWAYEGPLAVVMSGLVEGKLVLPVRLPTAPCNQPILDHYLLDPSRWHKVDLVRTRSPQVPGGWRYEAHLMVLTPPYVSPLSKARRAEVAKAEANRAAGIDVNVSKLIIASQMEGRALRLTRVERDRAAREGEARRGRRERRRQRALERSRRALNRAQYQLSKRQEKRARRRAAADLPPVEVIPQGPRLARGGGVPLKAYRRTSFRRATAACAPRRPPLQHPRHRHGGTGPGAPPPSWSVSTATTSWSRTPPSQPGPATGGGGWPPSPLAYSCRPSTARRGR